MGRISPTPESSLAVLHQSGRCYTFPMPTRRPRHVVTETDTVARALDAAAEHWPDDRRRRGRLLVRLVEEGVRALERADDKEAARRRKAVAETRGALTGLYGAEYLDKLRHDWPA
jgi:hypothetical protein